ncbi:Zn-dependent hydrolase [Mangrovibrevibacter kandeliae]|uniref:Zn-dependent hydrolase n=1 Tax=Mangrovibrevibacter kandeliae TaxID=2968473 RepID=UPI0021185EF7|nr:MULTISPECIES: Zn-dependent hydrolase [unclassified Aurantimonas]MCQ8781602.1 Zn-dependent hydrolase [Aurantimonas sp. CSK15Z-1]MCW4114952.1 Zn-dependent hydrolase [Aurantimonas sp. MSK8Z-1]
MIASIRPAPNPAAVPEPDIALAEKLFAELRERTGTAAGITRASYGLGEQIAHDMVRREANRLGMTCETDAGCNLYATLRTGPDGAERRPAIFVGSHLDSVPLGGNFDGAAGVLAGLAVAAGYRRAGILPPQDLTVAAIRAEESTWFGASYIGSRAALGRLEGSELDGVLRAGDLIRLGAAIDAAGGDTAALRRREAFLDQRRVGVFIEPHIEQGPALVDEARPVGIVTGIRGSFRHRQARCLGVYAHSGATPRRSRRDAALAVARLMVALDDSWFRLAEAGHDLVVTFGQLATDAAEAAFSKIAGRVDFSLDVRSQSTETLTLMRAELARAVASIEREQGVRFELGEETSSQPALMDPEIIEAFAALAERDDVPTLVMPCGAGHDAAVFAQAGIPTGMLFIRNRNGSHNPREAMEMADFAAACRILAAFCLRELRPAP